MRKYKLWFFTVLILILLSIPSIITVNYLIDPYNFFKTPTIKRMNVKKTDSSEYLHKARDIVSYKPNVIFLGSSRTRLGLDPEYYYTITGGEAYNSGLSGSNIYYQLSYFEYALLNNKSLKKVFIGLDFEGFNTLSNNIQEFNNERLYTTKFIKADLAALLISEQSIKDSIKVLLDSIKNEQRYTTEYFDAAEPLC